MKRSDPIHDGTEIVVVIAALILAYGFAAFFHVMPW